MDSSLKITLATVFTILSLLHIGGFSLYSRYLLSEDFDKLSDAKKLTTRIAWLVVLLSAIITILLFSYVMANKSFKNKSLTLSIGSILAIFFLLTNHQQLEWSNSASVNTAPLLEKTLIKSHYNLSWICFVILFGLLTHIYSKGGATNAVKLATYL